MSGLWADLVHFYDVPWNLYICAGTPPTMQREALIRSIRSVILEHPFHDDEDTLSKQNELSECTVHPISLKFSSSTFSGVAVCAELTMGSPFRFIQFSNSAKKGWLLLVRGSLGSQSLTDSFFEMVGISGYQILNLPSLFLSSQLEHYLEALPSACRPLREKNLDLFILHIIGKLDITVTAETPVAPNLKSLQVSVPATNVWIWLSTMAERGVFMIRLTDCLESMTGMKLSLGSSQGLEETFPYAASSRHRETASDTVTRKLQDQTPRTDPKVLDLGGGAKKGGHGTINDKEIPIAISEVSCAGFKLTRAGRFTLKKEPLNYAEDIQARDEIGNINATLIEAILDAANDRG